MKGIKKLLLIGAVLYVGYLAVTANGQGLPVPVKTNQAQMQCDAYNGVWLPIVIGSVCVIVMK